MTSTAVVAADSTSGDARPPYHNIGNSTTMPMRVGQLIPAVNGVLEQHGPDQENQGAPNQSEHGCEVARAFGMGQRQRIASSSDNDAGDDRHVQIGIGETRDPARIACV